MTWEEFKGSDIKFSQEHEPTDIECPQCGKYLQRYTGFIFTTYPPKYRYDCPNCGWYGMK